MRSKIRSNTQNYCPENVFFNQKNTGNFFPTEPKQIYRIHLEHILPTDFWFSDCRQLYCQKIMLLLMNEIFRFHAFICINVFIFAFEKL